MSKTTIEIDDFDDDVFDPDGPEWFGYGDDPVQSIGQMKTFGMRMPWGIAPVAAGPYKEFPEDEKTYFGIKCAVEIEKKHMIAVDIADFKTPNPFEAETAVFLAIAAMRIGMIPYFGCMGGLGRTGTVLGILAKVSLQSTPKKFLGMRLPWAVGGDPVQWVRENYRATAIETKAQEDFVRDFDVSWLAGMAVSLG